jgi:RNA polymerase sigma factor (TIGR02999 family)
MLAGMGAEDTGTTATLLGRLADGEDEAIGLLWQRVHGQVRQMAAAALGREGGGPTVDATELASEVWLKLHPNGSTGQWRTRGHFFGAASRAIMQLLVDRARARRALRRGGGSRPMPLALVPGELAALPDEDAGVIEELAHQLRELDAAHPRSADVARLRYISGLSAAETAQALGISETTARDDWTFARVWLRRRLESGGL